MANVITSFTKLAAITDGTTNTFLVGEKHVPAGMLGRMKVGDGSIEQDIQDRIYLTVTVDDEPGRDLGRVGRPGHRFFFFANEVVPHVNKAIA